MPTKHRYERKCERDLKEWINSSICFLIPTWFSPFTLFCYSRLRDLIQSDGTSSGGLIGHHRSWLRSRWTVLTKQSVVDWLHCLEISEIRTEQWVETSRCSWNRCENLRAVKREIRESHGRCLRREWWFCEKRNYWRMTKVIITLASELDLFTHFSRLHYMLG